MVIVAGEMAGPAKHGVTNYSLQMLLPGYGLIYIIAFTAINRYLQKTILFGNPASDKSF
jgi:hypothetical protein